MWCGGGVVFGQCRRGRGNGEALKFGLISADTCAISCAKQLSMHTQTQLCH